MSLPYDGARGVCTAADHPSTLDKRSTMTEGNQATHEERSFLEAGFLGFAVLNGVAALVLIGIPLLVSMLSGSFAVSDYGVGLAGLGFAAVFWALSRVARHARLSSKSIPTGEASPRS